MNKSVFKFKKRTILLRISLTEKGAYEMPTQFTSLKSVKTRTKYLQTKLDLNNLNKLVFKFQKLKNKRGNSFSD